jgi:hypothetical protein
MSDAADEQIFSVVSRHAPFDRYSARMRYPLLKSAPRISLSKSANSITPESLRATTTTSISFFNLCRLRRNISRIRRLIRFRTTARLSILVVTVIPSLDSSVDASQTRRRKCFEYTFSPVSRHLLISLRFFSRAVGPNEKELVFTNGSVPS